MEVGFQFIAYGSILDGIAWDPSQPKAAHALKTGWRVSFNPSG